MNMKFKPETIRDIDINSLTPNGQNRYVCRVEVFTIDGRWEDVIYCADPNDTVETGRLIHAEIEGRLEDGRLTIRKTLKDSQQEWKNNHDFMADCCRKDAFASESDPLKFKFDETGEQADKDAWLAKKSEIRGRFKKLAEMTQAEIDAIYPLLAV